MTSVTRQTVGTIRADPHMRATFAACLEETIAVGRAEGVALAPDLATTLLGFLEGLPADMKASMAADLEAGRRLELPWINGAIARLGDELDIDTPAHDRVCAELARFVEGA